MFQNKLVAGLFLAASLLQVCPSRMMGFELEKDRFIPARLDQAYSVITAMDRADLNQDGMPEVVSLDGETAQIQAAGQTLWKSPNSWQVTEARITDLNGDGFPELTLLVWRSFKPWPVDTWLPQGGRIETFHNAQGLSCHIILIGWREGKFRELWAGSALAEPVKTFLAADLNGDNQEELITLDGVYSKGPDQPARLLKAWEWNGFGFTRLTVKNGSYQKMVVIRTADGQNLIVVP